MEGRPALVLYGEPPPKCLEEPKVRKLASGLFCYRIDPAQAGAWAKSLSLPAPPCLILLPRKGDPLVLGTPKAEALAEAMERVSKP